MLSYGDEVGNFLKALETQEVRSVCNIHSVLGSRGIPRYTSLYHSAVDRVYRKFERADPANLVMTPVELISDVNQLSFGKTAQLFIPMSKKEILEYASVDSVNYINDFEKRGILFCNKDRFLNPLLSKDAKQSIEISSSLGSKTVVPLQKSLEKSFTSTRPRKLADIAAEVEVNPQVKEDVKKVIRDLERALPYTLHRHDDGAWYVIPSPRSLESKNLPSDQQEIRKLHIPLLFEFSENPKALLETTAIFSEPAVQQHFFQQDNIPSDIPDVIISDIQNRWSILRSYNLINRYKGEITTLDGERLLCTACGMPFSYLEYRSIYPDNVKQLTLDVKGFWLRSVAFVFWGRIWQVLREYLSSDKDSHQTRQKTARAFDNMFDANVYGIAEDLGIHPSTVTLLAKNLRAYGYGASISLYSHPRLYRVNPVLTPKQKPTAGIRRRS